MSREVIYRGRKIDLAVDTRRQPDGSEWKREVVLHPGAVAILPLLDGDRLVLVRNTRHAVGEALLELPAGTLEPPEPPVECAARELAEETGYRAAHIEPLCEFFTSPGVMSERMHLFVADGLTPGPTELQPGEELHTEIVPVAEALRWAETGALPDGKTVLALLLWARRAKR
jgi:ADP-ribose pyrophosphatase